MDLKAAATTVDGAGEGDELTFPRVNASFHELCEVFPSFRVTRSMTRRKRVDGEAQELLLATTVFL